MEQHPTASLDAPDAHKSPEQQHQPEQQSTTASFSASWTPSKATAFSASAVPLGKAPRAWERKRTQTVAGNGKVKTLWKRYELRHAQPDAKQAEVGPGKVVKRARVGSPVKRELIETKEGLAGKKRDAVTKFDPRKSVGLRRKPRAAVSTTDEPNTSVLGTVMEHAGDPVEDAPVEYPVLEDLEDAQEKAMVEPLSQEEEESFCEAAEAQLLGEAGIEPLPAGFNPMTEEEFEQTTERPSSTVEDLLIQLDSDKVDETGETEADATAEADDTTDDGSAEDVNEALAEQLSQVEDEEKKQPEESAQAEGTLIDISPFKIFEKIRDVVTGNSPKVKETPSHAAAADMPSKPEAEPVTYPTLDIFASPKKPVAEAQEPEVADYNKDEEEEMDAEDTQSTGSPEGGFAISLNDETVNLGALLMKNDNLSAIITDDAIEFEMDDSEPTNEPHVTEQATEGEVVQKDDASPADSPDELSMEFEPTETLTTTGSEVFSHLEDDKAKLSSFLSRVRAAKVNRSTSATRRESLQNRRDSDVVRKALASPRQVLEEKDANLSPRRAMGRQEENTLNLDQVLTSPLVKLHPQKPVVTAATPAVVDDDEQDELTQDIQSGSPSRRRSTRSRSTKLPQLSGPGTAAVAPGPNRISVKTDSGDKVSLNRTEAQQLADLVKKNTRKNKGASIPAPQRLARLKVEALAAVVDGDVPVVEKLVREGVRNVVWREDLVEYATSVATADLEAAAAAEEGDGTKAAPKKGGVQKMRRLRSLGGAVNGTPAKKVLQNTLMPDEVEEQKKAEAAAATAPVGIGTGESADVKEKKPRRTRLARPAASATATLTTPGEPAETVTATSNLASEEKPTQPTSAVPAPKVTKSKLQPPKKLNLNPVVASLAMQGQENSGIGLLSPAKKLSKIPAPASSLPAPSLLGSDITSGLRYSSAPKRPSRAVGKK